MHKSLKLQVLGN